MPPCASRRPPAQSGYRPWLHAITRQAVTRAQTLRRLPRLEALHCPTHGPAGADTLACAGSAPAGSLAFDPGLHLLQDF